MHVHTPIGIGKGQDEAPMSGSELQVADGSFLLGEDMLPRPLLLLKVFGLHLLPDVDLHVIA